MNNKFSLCVVAFLLLTSLSCTLRITETQCREGNWYEIGRRDGALGRPISTFDRYVNGCFEYEVKPDRKAYFEGRYAGLERYCTYQNGPEQGKLSRIYRYVCPPDLEPEFLAGYRHGKEIRVITTKLRGLKHAKKQIYEQMNEKERKLIANNLSYHD